MTKTIYPAIYSTDGHTWLRRPTSIHIYHTALLTSQISHMTSGRTKFQITQNTHLHIAVYIEYKDGEIYCLSHAYTKHSKNV